jgi:hypothetical protein
MDRVPNDERAIDFYLKAFGRRIADSLAFHTFTLV